MFGAGCVFVPLLIACFQRCLYASYLSASIARFDIRNGVVPFSSPVPVNITQYPFITWLMHPALSIKCYAAIVHKRFLITAARCNLKHLKTDYLLTVGVKKASESGEIYEIERIISHPKFNEDSLDNDVAVIKLKCELEFSEKVNKISLANEMTGFNEDDLFITLGYGYNVRKMYNNVWTHSSHQYKVYLPYVNQVKCQLYLNESPITNNMICVGDTKPENDAECNYEFGGPLLYKGQLMGIMSFAHDGFPCSLPRFPTVFASIPSARQFIDKVIRDHS